MTENSDSDASSSSNEVSYHSTPTPMDIEESVIENLSPATLLKKLNPQYKNRLFDQILRTKTITHIVGLVLNDYQLNREKFINSLVQLFIDISAYQYINVENYVKYNNLKDIVSYMEHSNNSILRKTGKYIVKMPKYGAKCKKIGEFLESFIMLSAKEKILYDTSIHIIFQIVEKMSESNLRPIKHTGVFIALKLQSGLIRISYMIGQKIDSYQHSLEEEIDPKTKRIFEYKIEKFYSNNNSVNKLIEFIHLRIFKNNWNHNDSQLHFMRNDCIVEVANWIDIFPDRFLHNDCVDFLIKSVNDNHSMVRLKAITLLSIIIKDYHLKMHQKKMYNIIVEISKRMNDINFTVAIQAVETLTMTNKFIKLPHTIRDEICKLIYYPHYPLAAAAGKFLIQRMNEYLTNTNDREECLKMLIFFEKKSIQRGFENKYPFVIETIIDSCPVLQDIPVYLSILENCKTDDESLTILINILTESVYQTFLGSCSLVRPKQIKRKVDPEKVEIMTKEFVKSIEKLTGLVSPLEKLTPLLILIRDYGMKGFNNISIKKKTTSSKD